MYNFFICGEIFTVDLILRILRVFCYSLNKAEIDLLNCEIKYPQYMYVISHICENLS